MRRSMRLASWLLCSLIATVGAAEPLGTKRGIIALQLHSDGPTEVRFKDFEIELNPKGE